MGACCGKDELGDAIPRNPAIDCAALNASKAPIVCLIGGPGVGKNTLGKRLAAKFGFVLVILSDLVRSEVTSDSERGQIMKKIMKEGRNLPADIIVQKTEEKMNATPSAAGFLLVGFPREEKQAKLFDKDVHHPSLCIYLWARRIVLEERMRSRAIANGRFDDTDMTIANRIKTFFGTVDGATGSYRDIMVTLDGEKSEEEVFALACSAVELMLSRLQH